MAIIKGKRYQPYRINGTMKNMAKPLFNSLLRAEKELKNAQENLATIVDKQLEIAKDFSINLDAGEFYKAVKEVAEKNVVKKQAEIEKVQVEIDAFESKQKDRCPHGMGIPSIANNHFCGGYKHGGPFNATDPSNRVSHLYYLDTIVDEDKTRQHKKSHDRSVKNMRLNRISRDRKNYQIHKWDGILEADDENVFDTKEFNKAKKLKKISVKNLFGNRSYSISLLDGLSVFCGANGLGKTTILTMLEYLFTTQESKEEVLDYFQSIPFESIKIDFDEVSVLIEKSVTAHKIYATFIHDEYNKTLIEIVGSISIEEFYYCVDKYIGIKFVFINPFKDLLTINYCIKEDDEKFKMLQEAFENVVYEREDPSRKRPVIKYGGVSLLVNELNEEIPLRTLSDGEGNALSILYNFIYNFDEDTIILMDEPERSLHICLQEDLSRRIADFVEEKNGQVFFASHSPYMLSGNSDAFVSADCIEE